MVVKFKLKHYPLYGILSGMMATKDESMTLSEFSRKGGFARAAALSRIQRQRIARKAARTRWAAYRKTKSAA